MVLFDMTCFIHDAACKEGWRGCKHQHMGKQQGTEGSLVDWQQWRLSWRAWQRLLPAHLI
jgi:hypothetical protein